jgi:ribosomal protein L7Ae-like RNA K-turn-binding protein
MSEAVKEILFVIQILESMGIKVQSPVTVRVDNMGAIFMAENTSSSSRTRHIDTRWHFVRELVEDKKIEIVFVRTDENVADVFTKNVPGEVFKTHVEKFVWGKQDVDD